MSPRNPYLVAGLAGLALTAAAALWWGQRRAPEAGPNGRAPAAPMMVGAKSAIGGSVTPLRDEVKPSPLKDDRNIRSRRILSDAEMLVKGGVLPADKVSVSALPAVSPAGPAAPGTIPPGGGKTDARAMAERRRHSIGSADWGGKVHQLIHAMRSGGDIEFDYGQVMDFLQGKDALGWRESHRNWIGDELMTIFAKDFPEQAFEQFKAVQENRSAPAAMRDYSVQHISDMVATNTLGRAGVDYIWEALAQGDPVTLSTALTSLHRLSEDRPELVATARVTEVAQRLAEHPDVRTQITAKAILKK